MKVQHFQDLNTNLVYIEAKNDYNGSHITKNAVYYDGKRVCNTGWRECKDLSLLQLETEVISKPACYLDPKSEESLDEEIYQAVKQALKKQAFDPDRDDDDVPVVVDVEAYNKYKALDSWTYFPAVTKKVMVAPTFEQVTTRFHHQNLFIHNALIEGDFNKATLWVYDRVRAVQAAIMEFMEEHDIEQLPTTDQAYNRDVPGEKKQFRFYKSYRPEFLKDLKWMKCWGVDAFYNSNPFESSSNYQIGTEEEVLSAYERDRNAVRKTLQLAYNAKFAVPALAANAATEILASINSALYSLSGVRERRDSKGSVSGAKNTLNSIKTKLEALIRG